MTQCLEFGLDINMGLRVDNGGRSSQVKSYSLGYMEQAPSRGHEASPQSGLGVGCKLCSSNKKLRGLSVRAQARRISIFLSHSLLWGGKGADLTPPCVTSLASPHRPKASDGSLEPRRREYT